MHWQQWEQAVTTLEDYSNTNHEIQFETRPILHIFQVSISNFNFNVSEMTRFFKKRKDLIKITLKQKPVLKSVQYWVHTSNSQKCKIRISLNLEIN